MKRKLTGVVMCGGKSSRMGQDKALLEIRPGVRQLDHLLGLLQQVCQGTAVSVGSWNAQARREALPLAVRVVEDAAEVEGPIAGVLAALRDSAADGILVLACDMPFVEVRHLIQLLHRRDSSRAATAMLAADGKPDPMCAVYEPSALPLLEAFVASGGRSLRRWLLAADIETVEPAGGGDVLASVNDPEALAAARRRLDAGRGA